MLKVAKFGGSSVSSAGQFIKVKNIVEDDESRKIVVVSAAGKRNKEDHKMTDLLYLCHAHLTYGVSFKEISDQIAQRFEEIASELKIGYDAGAEFSKYCEKLTKSVSVDELVSRGEYYTARMMAEFLGFTFVDARDCVFFSYDGQIEKEKTYAAIKESVDKYGKIVIPGFYGSLPDGKIKIMSRGGSDITGSIAAAAINADVYENWTDVSGVLMADPRIVENPKPIPKLTYSELRELAYTGASVLHEDSVLPVKEAGITLNIRNTNCPENPGTLIVDSIDSREESHDERFITGIAGRRDFVIITASKRGMNVCHALGKALSVFDKRNILVEHITLGLDSFAIVASSAALGDRLYEVVSEIQKECGIEDVSIKSDIALIAAVGRRMTASPGTSGKLFKALGDNNINIRTIAQGSDELAIIVGVENNQFEKAIKVLYEGFTA